MGRLAAKQQVALQIIGDVADTGSILRPDKDNPVNFSGASHRQDTLPLRFGREDDNAERGQGHFGAVLLVVAGGGFGDDGAPVALVTAAKVLAVGVDEFDPAAGARKADAVFGADDGSEVHDDGDGP